MQGRQAYGKAVAQVKGGNYTLSSHSRLPHCYAERRGGFRRFRRHDTTDARDANRSKPCRDIQTSIPGHGSPTSTDLRNSKLYCHRKFGPLSKTRLWYNIHLLERSIRWRNENEETSLPSLKPKLFLRLSAVKVPKQKCVGNPITLSDEQLSKWKRQLLENAATLFEPADKQSDASVERIAQLEQLVGRLTLALDIEKKASTYLS